MDAAHCCKSASQRGHSLVYSSIFRLSITSDRVRLIGRSWNPSTRATPTPWINYCCCLNKSWGDESTPSAVACLHQRGALVEISQLHGCEPPLFGQIRHGSDRVLVVARQKDDPAAALDDLVGSQGGRNQVIKTFHQLRACERLRNEDRGREAIQFFEGNAERVCRIDDRLAFPTRQGFRYVAMLFEQDRRDDCVGLERLLQ